MAAGRPPALGQESDMIELALAPQAPFGLIQLAGPQRSEFLERLLSNRVPTRPGTAASAYLLNVGGRPLVHFWVYAGVDDTWLVTHGEQTATALRELDMMHFGEKLTMRDVSTEWTGHLVVGSGRRAWLASLLGTAPPAEELALTTGEDWLWCGFPLLASGSELVWTRGDLGADELPRLSEADWICQRIEAGHAWPHHWGEKTLFLEIAEAGDYVDGKGCYPGQEVVARTLHRGHVNRHLELLRGEGLPPAPGEKLLAGGKEAGWVSEACPTSPSSWAAVGYVRREARNGELQRESGGSCRVEERHASVS